MCGIIGAIRLDSGAATLPLRAVQALSHRGPDSHGLYVEPPVAFGHRRLSIIDLETGRQPMSNEDGQVWIVYNGELYNYRELRKELIADGHTFRSESDTEVIIHAWEQWGTRCVERFRGMFAFAIADWRQRLVFLARDHLGIKPLYYALDPRQLAFASELQALRLLPGIDSAIDPSAIDQYLRFNYIPAPRTVFRNIHKLSPAHRMVVPFDGRTSGPERYWQLRFNPAHDRTDTEWEEELESVLRDSVRAHLQADVPFGAFLSGGLDSAAVVGLMSQELSRPVRTFSIGFDDREYSELEYARIVAQKWKTDHHEEIVQPKALEILPDLVRHYGEPFGDSSAIPTYYVSRLARQLVPMALSGDGGDEALAGYGRYQTWKQRLEPYFPQRSLWKRMLRPMAQRLLPSRFPQDGASVPATVDLWMNWMEAMRAAERRSLWRREYHSNIDGRVPAFDDSYASANGCPPESLGQYLDYHTYLPGDILTKVDIASMMQSLEVRTPLVDVRVVEFAATIPFNVATKVDSNGNVSGKRLLKGILSRHFDGAFIDRRKQGFNVPLRHWLVNGSNAQHDIEQRLTSSNAQLNEFFEPDAVRQLIAEQGDNRRDRSQSIWQLLFLEEWLDQVNRSIGAESVPQMSAVQS